MGIQYYVRENGSVDYEMFCGVETKRYRSFKSAENALHLIHGITCSNI